MTADRLLVAVFASPVSDVLLRWGAELGFRTVLVEPDPGRGFGVLQSLLGLDRRPSSP